MYLAFAACVLLICLTAFRFGKTSEKAAAGILAGSSFLTALVQNGGAPDIEGARQTLLLIDIAALLGFIYLSLTSRSFWPLWATAFLLIAVAKHLIVMLQPAPPLAAYALLQGAWVYPIMFLIVVGSLAGRNR